MLYPIFLINIEQTSATIVGTVPAEATKFKFTDGKNNAVTYIKTGAESKCLLLPKNPANCIMNFTNFHQKQRMRSPNRICLF